MHYAHRLVYWCVHGPIPSGKYVDHICNNRACVNLDHLQLISNRENILRGIGPTAINARKQACPTHDEPYATTTTQRYCRSCHREAEARRMAKKGVPLMPIDPTNYLQTASDGYLQVRRADTSLLGCIPSAVPTDDFIQTPIGAVEIRASLVYCAVPTPDQIERLREWPGFIPLSGLRSAEPIAADPSDQSDIGRPV